MPSAAASQGIAKTWLTLDERRYLGSDAPPGVAECPPGCTLLPRGNAFKDGPLTYPLPLYMIPFVRFTHQPGEDPCNAPPCTSKA